MASTTFSGPVTSTAGFVSGSDSIVSLTASTATITAASHAGRTMLLDRAAGVVATLPAATGSGNTYTFMVKTSVTSNAYTIQVANSSDVMMGAAIVFQDGGDTMVGFECGATDDTISMNGTTTGGLKGAVITVQDVATNLFAVHVRTAATGVEATVFSAAV